MFFPAHLLVSGRRLLLRHIFRLICLAVIALKSVDLAAAPPPPVQPVPEAALLALAQRKFGTLSRAEEELFRAAQEGRAASALAEDEKENDPANAANWPAERAVRAECIAWICTDPQASALVTYRGLQFCGMRIDGELDLGDADIKFQFLAWKCAFSGNISLKDAQMRGFHLLESKIKSLDASRATINGPVFLRGKSFTAEGEVNFVRATISGDVDCEGGQFSNADGLAFGVDDSRIEGKVFLRHGFRAQGLVSLVRATMGDLHIHKVIKADQFILDLRLAKVEIFWDDEQSWPAAGNLFLDGFRYERLYEKAPFEADKRKKWLGLQPRDKFRSQPYEQLAAALREMGHEGEARQMMIEKNRERARFTHFPQQGWWWYNVFGRFIGYGYAPWRAFAGSLAMILLGTLLFRLGSAHGLIGPTSENAYAKGPNGVIGENGQLKILETYPVFNAFVYSLESFIPLLKLDQSANWRPNANRRSEVSIFHRRVPYTGSLLRYYLYFHIASGWLLTSLWVGAITGLVKT